MPCQLCLEHPKSDLFISFTQPRWEGSGREGLLTEDSRTRVTQGDSECLFCYGTGSKAEQEKKLMLSHVGRRRHCSFACAGDWGWRLGMLVLFGLSSLEVLMSLSAPVPLCAGALLDNGK